MHHWRMKHECTTSQPFRMLRWILVFCILFALIGAEQSQAQNESGRRVISKEAFAHNWYDSVKHKFHLRVPIIRTLPPLNSGMPYDVLTAYLHLDSLARFNSDRELIQSSKAWIARPNLLKKTIASYYIVKDYDPLLFRQYDRETDLKSELYATGMAGIIRNLPAALVGAASNQKEREALMSGILPDYILRIRVLAIDSMPMALPARTSVGDYVYNVRAQVLDTIKGWNFQPCQDTQYEGSTVASSALPCLYFQYRPGSYMPRLADWHLKEDNAFTDSRKNFTMHVGQEAVVFLGFINQKFDSTHDAFELSVEPQASYNALPIIDGQVRDVNRIWSDELMINYVDWKNHFSQIRNKVLTGTY